MKRPRNFLLILTCVLLTACNSNQIYKEFESVDGEFVWKKGEIKRFRVDIKDPNLNYDIKLAVRNTIHYQFRNLFVRMTVTSPDNKVSKEDINIVMRDESGLPSGEILGDIVDLEEIIAKDVSLPITGTYLFEIEHIMPHEDLEWMMEIGLILEKVEGRS